MIYLPTLRQIQFLLALKQQGSFHAAATACGVTQSTLSAGIQDMEAVLRQKVIDRSQRRGVHFTPLGQELLERGEAAIKSLQDVTMRAQQGNRPFAWPLRLGVIPTVAPYLLPRILKPLQKKFPQLVLHVNEVQSDELVDRIGAGDLDGGLLAFPFPTADLHTVSLYQEKFVCAVPRNQYLQHKRMVLNDIDLDQLLLLAEGHCLRDHVLAACHLKNKTPAQSPFSATSLATIIQLVAHGYGVTLLPQMAADNLSLPGTVRILPVSPVTSRQIGIVWSDKGSRHKDMQMLVKALKDLKIP